MKRESSNPRFQSASSVMATNADAHARRLPASKARGSTGTVVGRKGTTVTSHMQMAKVLLIFGWVSASGDSRMTTKGRPCRRADIFNGGSSRWVARTTCSSGRRLVTPKLLRRRRKAQEDASASNATVRALVASQPGHRPGVRATHLKTPPFRVSTPLPPASLDTSVCGLDNALGRNSVEEQQ